MVVYFVNTFIVETSCKYLYKVYICNFTGLFIAQTLTNTNRIRVLLAQPLHTANSTQQNRAFHRDLTLLKFVQYAKDSIGR